MSSVDALHRESAVDLARACAAGERSARSIADAFLARAASVEPGLDAFLELDAARVRAQADAIDARRDRGETLGPLAGVPVAIKDLIAERDAPLTCGSRILENYVSPYDAHVIERLRAADAVLFGRTNLDEFAMGSTTETSAFKVTKNPWDPARFPGGSSGGSAVAVAARMAPLALGTETGGSIRQPASLCGVYGLKTTYGRVSRYGAAAYASSLDQIGPFATSAADLALLLGVIAGRDTRDSTSADEPVPDYAASLGQGVEGLRIGVPREFFGDGVDPEVRATVERAIETLRGLGAETRDVSLPHTEYGIPVYYLVATSEASSNLARYDGVHYTTRADAPDLEHLYTRSRGDGFGLEVKKRIMLGTFALSAGYYDAYYKKAQQVRTLIRRDFDAAFADVDVLVGPVAPAPAAPLGAVVDDALAMYMMDVLTVTANLAGICALSCPAGFTEGRLPIGVQLLAPPFAEPTLLRTAAAFEAATDYSREEPIA